MANAVIDKADERSAWRSQWRLLKDQLNNPIPSEESLWDLLLAPLVLLGLDKDLTNDQAIGQLIEIHGKWKNLQIGPPLPQEALRNFRWIGDTQLKLLQDILPDWYNVLNENDVLSVVLKGWFMPSSSSHDDANVGAVLMCSLATLTTALSEHVPDNEGQIEQKSETWKSVQNILPRFVTNFSLVSIVRSCQILIPPSQRELQWTTSIRHLISLPDRIANAYQGRFPHSLSLQSIRAKVGNEIEQLVFDGIDPAMVSILLKKLLRSGWFQDTQNWGSNSISVWPAILRGIAQRIGDDGHFTNNYRTNWSKVMSKLDETDREEILVTLVDSLDRVLRKGGKALLVNEKEAFRAGAEGMEFLSAPTWQIALCIASIIEIFLPIDGDQGGDKLLLSPLSSLLPNSSAFKNPKIWSPLMVRILMHIVDKFDDVHLFKDFLLIQSTKVWSQQTKSASWNEEVYLDTLLIILIHTAPSTSKSLNSLSTLPDFIQGVSQHLSHMSPIRRRMGMLLAEIVSERSGKALKFGKAAWDGKGDGREEARVLRALALGFNARERDIKLDASRLLSALQLAEVVESIQEVNDYVQPKKRTSKPSSRTLPARKPAPARTPMIQMIGEDSEDGEDGSSNQTNISSLMNVKGGKNLISHVSDDEEISSSESGTSSDEEDEKADDIQGQEEGKAFGMATPSNKKKPRTPIYISQLAPLLRSNERDGVRMGIKYCEDLIRRKSGWGGEVNENAVDLCLALLALHNNFKIAQFEQRRLGALTALVRASPSLVAPCLAEHYFDHQYSMVQRIAMLNALAFGASELATGERASGLLEDGKKDDAKQASSANRLAEQFSQLAMKRAREEGKERMPHIRNEEALLINRSTLMTNATRQRYPTKVESTTNSGLYLPLANSCFIFPLVNRLWKHIQSGSIHQSRNSSQYMGAGRTIIDMPFLMSSLLDTLAVLCHYAQNETNFRKDVVPEILQMVLALTRTHLSQISQNPLAFSDSEEDENHDGGSHLTILGASASLVLVLLDSSWQLDFGASIIRQNANLLNEVQVWSNAIFEAAEKGNEIGLKGNAGMMNRSSRSSAAILIRINEIHEHQRQLLEGRIVN